MLHPAKSYNPDSRESYILKKKSSKHIDMRSSFEDLVVTSLTVKTESNLDKQIGRAHV